MASSNMKSTTTSSSYKSSSRESHESFSNTGGLFSTSNISTFTSPSHHLEQSGQSSAGLEKAQAALKERGAQLDEREAALKKQQEDLAAREDALDAAHERLIGGGDEDEDEDEAGKSSATIDELQKENEKLRAELATSKQKSGRFLSRRAREEDASGRDRFRLSERTTTPGGGLPMGFDPQMVERWRIGHKMMTPRKPRTADSRPDVK